MRSVRTLVLTIALALLASGGSPTLLAADAGESPNGPPAVFFLHGSEGLFTPPASAQADPLGEFGAPGPLLASGRSALACPTGVIPNFTVSAPSCDTTCVQNLSWVPPTGADVNTLYDVYRGISGDYCKPNPVVLLGSTNTTKFTSSGIPYGTVQSHYVQVRSCSVATQYTLVTDTFQTAPAPPTLSGRLSGPGEVTLTFSQPDARSFSVSLYRAPETGSFTPILSGAFQNECPAGSSKTFIDTNLQPGIYRYLALNYGNNANGYTSVNSPVISVVVPSTSCQPPGAPVLTSRASRVTSGQSFLVNWSAATALTPGSTYQVETSRDGFTSIESVSRATSTSIVLATAVSATSSRVAVRVRAVQACGTQGPYSNVVFISVDPSPFNIAITKTGPSWIAAKSDPPPSAIVKFKNVGGISGRLNLSSGAGFFTFNPAFLDLAPAQEGSVTLMPTSGVLAAPGVYSGSLVGSAGALQISTPVLLTVTPAAVSPGSHAGTRTQASSSLVLFSAGSGSNPASQSLTLSVGPITGGGPVFVSPSIGPGGSWLNIFSQALSQPVPASGQITVNLSVDRSKRTASDGSSPFRTLLQFNVVGANTSDSAVVEIVDVDTLAISGGSGQRPSNVLPPSGTSFIIPTTVKQSGLGGAVFISDGWLKNNDASTVSADLFLTPQDQDGNTSSSVSKCSLQIPPGNTVRLSDLMKSLFSTTGTGQVELRSDSTSALTLRTTVESTTGGDPASKYGTEIPTVSFGSGVGLNEGVLAIPGIDDDATHRANLILTETRGEQVTVKISLYNPAGTAVGNKSYVVPAHGKIQVGRIVNDVASGATLTGGWLSAIVTAGLGRVVPVATVIDNRSNSFSAIVGQGPSASAQAGSRGGVRPALALPQKFIVPAAVRARGISTQFVTDLQVANPTATPASLNLSYNYIDLDDGNTVKSVQRTVVIPARGSLAPEMAKDVLVSLFNVTNQSKGSIVFEGAVSQVAASAAISAQVDSTNPAAGYKTAQINRAFLDSSDMLTLGSPEHRFAGGEKSVQKRTSLILLEVDGAPCSVNVKVNSGTGEKIAERLFPVRAGEYFQLVDLFDASGLNLGEGPYQNMEVVVQVTSGTGRVIALSTVNDNISKNPEIFVLQQPGSGGPTTGF